MDNIWVPFDPIPTSTPYSLYGPVVVENSDQSGLLVVGGLQHTGPILAQSFIFELTCPKSGCQWKILEQKLKEPRGYHVGFLVDDSPDFNCTLNQT